VTRPKLSIIRSLDRSLAAIPYERTSVPATWPLPLHVGGFVASTSIARLRGQTTYGGPSMLDHWYRENDALRAKIDDLVDAAAQRVYFDANTVLRLRDEHLAGDDNHIDVLAPITTLESWFQQHIDDGPVNDVTIASETTDTVSPKQD
jgi:asparagine synthase (glutamine-hydrolysing)